MSIWPLSSVWHINMIIFMFSHVSKTIYWQIQRGKVTKIPWLIKYSDYTQSIRIMKWREQWMHASTIFVILQIFLLNRPFKKKNSESAPDFVSWLSVGMRPNRSRRPSRPIISYPRHWKPGTWRRRNGNRSTASRWGSKAPSRNSG